MAKGELNDFTVNVLPDEPYSQLEPTGGPKTLAMSSPSAKAAAEVAAAGPQIIIVNLPPGPIDMTVAGVDIIVRDPKGPRVASRPVTSASISASTTKDKGGDLAGLLFVTDPDRLRLNVGRSEADAAIARIEERGGQFVSGSGDDFSDRVVDTLGDGRSHQGVVIVGGYDVVQPHRVDCLDPELRRGLGRKVTSDIDQFWVWSDAAFADTDGDGLAEFPVSRVPDARDARMLKMAFAAERSEMTGRFGIRNVHRPFADEIWKGVAGTGDILVSEPFRSVDLDSSRLAARNHYHMLHGELDDGTRFTGEDDDGYPLAFEVKQVPTSFSGVAFTGCCWGALIVDGSALQYVGRLPPPRVVEASIALSYLKAGAQAFIGCTGAHYSGPSTDREANFAMELHEAFWEHLEQSGSASQALHSAKLEFAASIVQGTNLDPLSTARRLKNLAQFTCLGLGW